jgi:hypothetical protein
MRKMGPGMYVDSRGTAHISAAEVCEHMGVDPTPAHMDIVESTAREAFRKLYPNSVFEVFEPDQPDEM